MWFGETCFTVTEIDALLRQKKNTSHFISFCESFWSPVSQSRKEPWRHSREIAVLVQSELLLDRFQVPLRRRNSEPGHDELLECFRRNSFEHLQLFVSKRWDGICSESNSFYYCICYSTKLLLKSLGMHENLRCSVACWRQWLLSSLPWPSALRFEGFSALSCFRTA